MSFLQSIINTMTAKPAPPAGSRPKAAAAPPKPAAPKVASISASGTRTPISVANSSPRDSEALPETSSSSTGVFQVTGGSKRRKLDEDSTIDLMDDEKRAARLAELRAEKAKWEQEEKQLAELQEAQTFGLEEQEELTHEDELLELQQCVISTKEACEAAAKVLRRQEVIAADCEWVTSETNVRQLSLVQVATGHKDSSKQKCYLFDVITAGPDLFDWGLREIMESPKIIKLFHDCRWDSRVLDQYKCKLTRVFDTQIAHCVFSRQMTQTTPFPVSLNTLLDRYAFGEKNRYKDIAKTEMEADKQYWIRRPLSELQIRYARDDVLKLPVVYRQFSAGLHPHNVKIIEAYSDNYVNQLRNMKDEAEVEARYAPPTDGTRARPKYGIATLDDDITRDLDRRAIRETARGSRNLDATANYFPKRTAPITSSVPAYYSKYKTTPATPKAKPTAAPAKSSPKSPAESAEKKP